MTDDTHLLRRYVELRSEADFTELVRRNLSFVYRTALRRTGGRGDLAEEISQYVFTALARNAKALVKHTTLTGWLYTTTRFGASRALRAERRRMRREQQAFFMSESFARKPDVSSERERVRLAQELDGLMDKLSERERELILLRFYHDRPFAQIGAVFGLSEDAARKRVERSLDRLRALLAKRGVTSTAVALASLLTAEAGLAAPVGLAETIATAALAPSALAAGLSLSSIVQFMGTTKSSLGVAGFLALAGLVGIPAIGTAAYQYYNSARAKAELTGTEEVMRTDAVRLRRTEQEVQALDERLAEMQNRLDEARASRRQSSGSVLAKVNGPRDPRADAKEFLASHAEAIPLILGTAKAQIHKSLSPFYRSAALTPAQIDEIETRAASYWLGSLGVTPDGLINPSASDYPVEAIRAVIGDEGLQRFRDYQRLQPAYRITGEIALAVGLHDAAPLAPAQSDQIARIIAENSEQYQSGGKADLSAIDWAKVVAQSRTVLTANQLQAAQAVLNAAIFQQAQQTAIAALTQNPKE